MPFVFDGVEDSPLLAPSWRSFQRLCLSSGVRRFSVMTPCIIIFAAVFCLAGYGLQRRTVWAWWGGWVVFFLAAGMYGTYTYSALYYAETLSATLAAVVYIAGGAVLWVPAAVWWSGRRSYFGRSPAVQRKKVDNDPGNP